MKTRLSGGMADASDLGSDAAGRKGSSPFSSTKIDPLPMFNKRTH